MAWSRRPTDAHGEQSPCKQRSWDGCVVLATPRRSQPMHIVHRRTYGSVVY